MIWNFCCECSPSTKVLSSEEIEVLDKSLGNIKKAHKAMTFCGLITFEKKKAMMLHYLTSPSFMQRT